MAHGAPPKLLDLSGDGQLDVATLAGASPGFHERMLDESWDAFRPFRWLANGARDEPHLRMAELDGSGVTDIAYLGRDSVRLYFNRSGNGWSAARPLARFPDVDALADVDVADLLGNGTACLVWSTPSLVDARRPMRFVDL